MSRLLIEASTPLCLLQDAGRFGVRHLVITGVPVEVRRRSLISNQGDQKWQRESLSVPSRT